MPMRVRMESGAWSKIIDISNTRLIASSPVPPLIPLRVESGFELCPHREKSIHRYRVSFVPPGGIPASLYTDPPASVARAEPALARQPATGAHRAVLHRRGRN